MELYEQPPIIVKQLACGAVPTSVIRNFADTIHMSVSGVSMDQALQLLDSFSQRENVSTQIAVAVLKQVQDQQASQAEALVRMIRQSTPDGSGSIVNLLA